MSKDVKSLEDIKRDTEQNIEILALRDQVKGLKKEIHQMEKDYGDLRGYFRDLDVAAEAVKFSKSPQIYKPSKKELSVSSPCVGVLHWTDWHYGAVQEPDEIEFMGEFTPDILERRIDNCSDDFVKWIGVQRGGYAINECVVLVTGDMISGDIHRELSINNAFPTPVQAFKCGLLLAKNVVRLAPHFNRVRVEYITPDNHGRLTKRPQAKQEGLNTHNYTVAHVAELALRDIDNVEFNIYYSFTKVVEVAERRYLLTHGHGVKGWAGFPYYGIERMVSREALVRLNLEDMLKFDRVIMGHWHAPLAHPWYWIGGSASGTDAFDRKNGRRAEPIQNAWLVHPKHGEFNRVDFRLRD